MPSVAPVRMRVAIGMAVLKAATIASPAARLAMIASPAAVAAAPPATVA